MKVIIDRFEGNFAIVELENKTFVNMPEELIPLGALEGDVLSIEVDTKEVDNRRKQISKIVKDIWVD